MLKAKCIEKIRDKNNHIIGYKIIGNDKKPMPVKPESLKKAIRSGQLEVTNLTLTSDNRLIDKKPVIPSKPTTQPLKSTTTPSKLGINAETMLNKAKTSGYSINTFRADCGHKCYIASSPDNTKHLILIPDDVEYIYNERIKYDDLKLRPLYNYLSKLSGALRVVGGKGLILTHYMFYECEAQSIDLSSFDTRNVTDMSEMFANCKAQSLDLSSFNTSNVTTMYGMFRWCEAQSIDLSSFNTSKVTDMYEMFWGCQAKSLDVSSFDTSKVECMIEMFGRCRAKILNISHFSTKSLTATADMFEGCEAEYIDFGSFNLSRVLVNKGVINSIVEEDEYEEIHSIFENCNAEIRATDRKVLSEYKCRNKVRRHYY